RSAGVAVLGGPGVRLLRADYAFLSWSPPLHRRALAVARVRVQGVDLTVASTHLDLVAGARLKHVNEIVRLLAPSPVPVVLAGDFNEEPGADGWNLLSRTYQDAYATAPEGGELTFSAYRPKVRIDGIFVDRRLKVVGCGVPEGLDDDVPLASDHRPLLARIAPR
ncbi:endonuclease/exonuclease/phosphatase family protein, partial [Actinocorallia lasiicapitis]